MNIKYDFEEVTGNIDFEGGFVKAEPYGFGHINDTFAAYFKKPDGTYHRYILQRINDNVFKNPEKLIDNVHGITSFIRRKVIEGGGDPDRETLNLIPAKDGKYYYRDSEGRYWRGYVFIENARTYQVVESLEHFYNAGKAFGKFQSLLSGYPADTLYETIPNFHNTRKRYGDFIGAVERDVANKAAGVRKEIEFVMRRADDASVLIDLLEAGRLPIRVTHNDTKFNNVMIDDKTGQGLCVIDLDTVMPGLSVYDFGDSIRSGANPAAEDEKDLSKVWMELSLFEQFTRGFMQSSQGFLTPMELDLLPFGAKLMTFECGMRFLADYLDGDVYYKVRRDGHNLDRARTQFKMVADMEDKEERMREIVKRVGENL